MADVQHASGLKLVLKIGDGASPEHFTALCTINAERGISFNGQDGEFEIPDCSDPEQIAWIVRERRSNSIQVTGSGIVNVPDVATLDDWYRTGASKNCQVWLDLTGAEGGYVWEGAFKLTWNLTGNRGEKLVGNITLDSDGEVEGEAAP